VNECDLCEWVPVGKGRDRDSEAAWATGAASTMPLAICQQLCISWELEYAYPAESRAARRKDRRDMLKVLVIRIFEEVSRTK